jgi:hypothetical protein
MSTRSNIAIEDPKTKKVKVIYVHSDGYPYGVGKCLVDHYNNSLQWQLNSLSMEMPATWAILLMNVVFILETGREKKIQPESYRDEWMYMDAMKGDVFIEYIYIFKDNRWHVSTQIC